MSTLRVIDPGFRATIQDRGRTGHLRSAVPIAGPADPWSFEVAQRLVGNGPTEAAIEVVGLPFRFALDSARVVALTGRDVRARTRSRIPNGTSFLARAGEEVVVEGTPESRFTYVAVSGGIAVPPVLGSRSTHLPTAIGPAPLSAGAELPLGPARAGAERAGVRAPEITRPAQIRAMPGPHADRFGRAARERLTAASFRVGERSDRMGVRLEHAGIEAAQGEILSCGVVAGAIQVPHGGDPIVLLADHQTTGGYAVIAVVIATDLGHVAQTAPGEEVAFQEVDRATAVELLRRQREALATLGMLFA